MADKPKDAIATLEPLLQANPLDAKVLRLAASAYEASGNTPEAVRVLREAIVTDPRNTDLYLDFANLSMDHQSFPVGIDMINSGLETAAGVCRPPLSHTRHSLCSTGAGTTRPKPILTRRTSLDPAEFARDPLLRDCKPCRATIPIVRWPRFERSWRKSRTIPTSCICRLTCLAQKGTEPGQPISKPLCVRPRRPSPCNHRFSAARDVLAKLYLQAGQNQLAIEQCRKALNSDPKNQTAVYHLIQGLRKTGAKSEIPDLLKRLAELRAESSRQEIDRNRYKLVQDNAPGAPARP